MTLQKKNFIWNMLGSTAVAFTSLAFLVIATRINGEEKAGIFSFAFATASIFYIIGTYILRSFQVTDIKEEFSDTDYIFNRIFTCALMMISAAVFVCINGYSFIKATVIILLCLVRCLEALSEVFYGIFQKNERLYQAGISMFFKALIEVILFLTVDFITKNILISSVVLVLVYIFGILFYDIPKFKKSTYKTAPFSNKKNAALLKAGFFTFVFNILNLYLVNASRYSLDRNFNSSTQTIYGIVIMPATFMSLLGIYLIQPFLTKISSCVKNKDHKSLSKSIGLICLAMLMLGGIVLAVAYLLEEPVLSFIFGINLKAYKTDMMIIIFGSVFYGLAIVLSNILIAFRRTGAEALIYFTVSVSTLIISNILVKKYEIRGAGLTYMISMITVFLLLSVLLYYSMLKYKKQWAKEK